MTVDEAVRELLSISSDVRRVAVLGPGGEVLGAAPLAMPAQAAAAAERLWQAARRRAEGLGGATLEHVLVQHRAGAVAVLQQGDTRIVALAAPQAASGLLLFDLRTCLTDALAGATPEGSAS
jgi:predicted regulator of Ras-like GTPase activity (Roadblock/LC7/MglB family)